MQIGSYKELTILHPLVPAVAAMAVGFWMGCHATTRSTDRSVVTDLGPVIHEYLMSHPEVLPAMSAALQQQQRARFDAQAKQALSENAQAIFGDAADGSAGATAAGKVVVEFFDAQCPFCKQLAPDLARLLSDDHEVRIIYKEFPILGGASLTAAKAGLAAAKQGKYAAFHDALMADKTAEGQLGEDRILQIAQAVGLDIGRLKADMASPETEAKISHNLELGKKLGLSGTPDLIVAGHVISGFLPYDQIRKKLAVAPGAEAAR